MVQLGQVQAGSIEDRGKSDNREPYDEGNDWIWFVGCYGAILLS